MDFHNANEDIVINSVHNITKEIEASGNRDKLCLCYQCRVDTICYVLNRIEPNYIVSNRGHTRLDRDSIKKQQLEADLTLLVYKGIRLVNHNQRPTAPHDGTQAVIHKINYPVYDIPTIAGRIFNGVSFEPISGIDVSLFCDGELVKMRNSNWQNPFSMVESTPGSFSFCLALLTADSPDTTKEFKFSIRIQATDFEPLIHFFNISTVSKFHTPHSYTLNKTFKLPDLYLFPPGEDEVYE
jgi:competence protein ComFB